MRVMVTLLGHTLMMSPRDTGGPEARHNQGWRGHGHRDGHQGGGRGGGTGGGRHFVQFQLRVIQSPSHVRSGPT